jgi:hypothetical protein
MTRSGSLAYYLAAWVIGCFIVSLGPWIHEMRAPDSGASHNILFNYFIALIIGAADLVFFAFLLRLCVYAMRIYVLGVWVIAGAILAPPLTAALSWAGHAWSQSPSLDQGPLHLVNQCVLVAPSILWDLGIWVVVLDGALIGATLFLVDRAFTKEYPPPA